MASAQVLDADDSNSLSFAELAVGLRKLNVRHCAHRTCCLINARRRVHVCVCVRVRVCVRGTGGGGGTGGVTTAAACVCFCSAVCAAVFATVHASPPLLVGHLCTRSCLSKYFVIP